MKCKTYRKSEYQHPIKPYLICLMKERNFESRIFIKDERRIEKKLKGSKKWKRKCERRISNGFKSNFIFFLENYFKET